MKVVCCYTALNPTVRLSHPDGVIYHDCNGSVDNYHNYFVYEWQKGERFINVEHDVIVPPNRLQELWDCPKPWCIIPYPYTGHPDKYLTYSLGVAKFHESLMCYFPTLIMDLETDALTDPFKNYPPRHFMVLADRIALRLYSYGYVQHEHWPPVEHLHH